MQASDPAVEEFADHEAIFRELSIRLTQAKLRLREAQEYYRSIEWAFNRQAERMASQREHVKSCVMSNEGSRNATPPVEAR